MENIEVYHEFWFEEATNLATKLDIQMKLPGKFRRAQQGNLESQLTSESYYKDTLSVPTVEHIIQELKDIFSEQHLKALKCLSLVPSVMGQLKFNTSEEHHADMYRSDLPNPDTPQETDSKAPTAPLTERVWAAWSSQGFRPLSGAVLTLSLSK